MNAQEFSQLYKKQNSDETITSFQNEPGFSLIRLYPKDTLYYKDGRRMFIKVALLDRGFFYGVDMTKPEKRGEKTDYIITDGEEYKRKITNYLSDDSEFIFNDTTQRMIHKPTNKSLTLNEFVDILAENHLADRLFWKRKLNALASGTLKILFWLSDRHYERVRVSIDKYHFSRDNKPVTEEQENIEPFFKYFYITKNLIFSILMIAFLLAIVVAIFPDKIPLKYLWNFLFGEFSLSNPLIVLLFFLTLFSSEKLSRWLNKSIRTFLMPEKNNFSDQHENFVEKLHNFQHRNTFNLKLKTRTNRL